MAGESTAGKPPEPPTSKEKLLFYTTGFFILLGIFSLFGFLFLVPFVIEPAFTTIFAAFDVTPAMCVTRHVERMRGVSNCSWTSCREGCTREVYECTQIRVNYKITKPSPTPPPPTATPTTPESAFDNNFLDRRRRLLSMQDYDYSDILGHDLPAPDPDEETPPTTTDVADPSDSEWFFVGAKLLPNVKGCGYPPMLNCTVFLKNYSQLGTNFSCFYSTVDPGIVITQLDMLQVYRHLLYALAIPIPSFIASVVYLTLAYLYIYSEDSAPPPRPPRKRPVVEASPLAPLSLNPAASASGSASLDPPPTTGALTPASEVFRDDMASFGHQLKVAMADDFLSRDSLGSITFVNSSSLNG